MCIAGRQQELQRLELIRHARAVLDLDLVSNVQEQHTRRKLGGKEYLLRLMLTRLMTAESSTRPALWAASRSSALKALIVASPVSASPMLLYTGDLEMLSRRFTSLTLACAHDVHVQD